jgi:hypothetical protein
VKLPWWLAPNGRPPAEIWAGPTAPSLPPNPTPVTKLNPPPAPTTLTWIVDRRPTAVDAFDEHVEIMLEGGLIGIGRWQDAAPGGCWANYPWAHCPNWSEPEVLIPDQEQLNHWVRQFSVGNAADKPDCTSIVTFIATRTAEWIAEQRKGRA